MKRLVKILRSKEVLGALSLPFVGTVLAVSVLTWQMVKPAKPTSEDDLAERLKVARVGC